MSRTVLLSAALLFTSAKKDLPLKQETPPSLSITFEGDALQAPFVACLIDAEHNALHCYNGPAVFLELEAAKAKKQAEEAEKYQKSREI